MIECQVRVVRQFLKVVVKEKKNLMSYKMKKAWKNAIEQLIHKDHRSHSTEQAEDLVED